MRTNVTYVKILVLISSSLVTIAFPILGMYISWNWMSVINNDLRSFIVLVVGIFCFAISVLLFRRLADLLSFKEEVKK